MVAPSPMSPIVTCISMKQLIEVPLTIESKKPIKVTALLDSGAAGMFVAEGFVRQHKLSTIALR